jgi:nucleotide-binding universal stress UspA family protein
MEKISKILAPTDFSELSQAGVRHALELAKAFGADVTVYHVINSAELIKYPEETVEGLDEHALHTLRHPLETYQQVMSRFLKNLFSDLVSGVKISEKVEIGAPDKNIVSLAEQEGSDMIVMSTHGRTGLSHVLVGSVTEKVVRQAHCRVLAIHPQPKEESKQTPAAVG